MLPALTCLAAIVCCVLQGGMILCGVMARVDITTAKIRSCICMGSGLFLEGACTAGHAGGD
jgi:hypothetical protein